MGQTVLVLIVVPIYLLLPVTPTSSAQVLMKRMNVLSNLILDSSWRGMKGWDYLPLSVIDTALAIATVSCRALTALPASWPWREYVPLCKWKKNLSKEIIFSRRASTYLTGRIPRKLIWTIAVPRPLEWESSPSQPLTAKRFGLTLHFSYRERMPFDSFILWYPDSGRVTYYTSIATISRRGVKEIALYNFVGSPWEGSCLSHKSPTSPPLRVFLYF